MYLDTVEALPIQTSGLSFLKNMSFLDERLSFSKLVNRCTSTLNYLVKFIPDLVIAGDYHSRDGLFDLDPQLRDNPDHLFTITGIPDDVPSLDFYKFKDAVYTQYIETQDNKGILFQVIPGKSPLIPVSYGTY